MIDDHCHLFTYQGGALDLSTINLFSDMPPGIDPRRPTEAGPRRLAQQLMTDRLAALLRCNAAELAEARGETSLDWPGYVQRLLDDARITEIVFDLSGQPATPSIHDMRQLTGRPAHWLARADYLIDELIEAGSEPEQILDSVGIFCRNAISEGCVGFKSAIAYRTGLSVDPAATIDQAKADLEETQVPIRIRGKACRDLAVMKVLAIAVEHDMPVQFHTGIGDASLSLASARPLLLEPLLESELGREATIVLIHGAFPRTDELACLVGAHPNTYAELSLFTICAPLSVERRLGEALDLLPVDRVCFGTDGHHEPETAWFGARMFMEGWEHWQDGVSARGVSKSWLEDAFEMVTTLNAQRIYGL